MGLLQETTHAAPTVRAADALHSRASAAPVTATTAYSGQPFTTEATARRIMPWNATTYWTPCNIVFDTGAEASACTTF